MSGFSISAICLLLLECNRTFIGFIGTRSAYTREQIRATFLLDAFLDL
jgi:hypothetical protein